MALQPRTLPKVRDQILRHLDNPNSVMRSDAVSPAVDKASLDVIANSLRAAEFYWVKADMVALAMASGESLTETRWATSDRPSGCGLLIWEGGISSTCRTPQTATWPSPATSSTAG